MRLPGREEPGIKLGAVRRCQETQNKVQDNRKVKSHVIEHRFRNVG